MLPFQTLRIDPDTRPAAASREEATEASEGPPELATTSALPPVSSQTARAISDITQGANAFYFWGLLGWQDIRQGYRRSILGPLWHTISMGMLVIALGTLYSTLLDIDTADYVPFLALGFIIWTLISGVITDGCKAFTSASSLIKQVDLPLSVHIYRMVWGHLIVFGHNSVIFIAVAVLFSIWPSWTGLLAFLGLVLLCLNGVWAGLFLGLVSSRFRDVPPLVASIMRIAFFLTPIIWMPELLPSRVTLLNFNPFFHLIELVRAPLLGQVPGLVSWLAASGFTLVGWLVTFEMFRRYRWRIAYWV